MKSLVHIALCVGLAAAGLAGCASAPKGLTERIFWMETRAAQGSALCRRRLKKALKAYEALKAMTDLEVDLEE